MSGIEKYAHIGIERFARSVHEAQYLINRYNIIPKLDGEQ